MLESSAPFAGPAWTVRLPLICRTIEDVATLNTHRVQNAEVIRNCASLGDARNDSREDDPQREDILRLESKLNALFDMVGLLLEQTLSIPDPVECVIQRDGIRWRAPKEFPVVNSNVHLSLYLNKRYPRPLEIGGRIEKINEQEQLVTVRFLELDEVVADGLEKIIFREHRRAVANRRRRL